MGEIFCIIRSLLLVGGEMLKPTLRSILILYGFIVKSSLSLIGECKSGFNGINLVSRVVDMDSNEMKSLSFKFRKEHNLIMVLASKQNKKALLTVLVSDNLIEKGVNASTLVKEIAKEIDGGGGGQNFFATAGGRKVDGIDKAINKAKKIVAKQKSQ